MEQTTKFAEVISAPDGLDVEPGDIVILPAPAPTKVNRKVHDGTYMGKIFIPLNAPDGETVLVSCTGVYPQFFIKKEMMNDILGKIQRGDKIPASFGRVIGSKVLFKMETFENMVTGNSGLFLPVGAERLSSNRGQSKYSTGIGEVVSLGESANHAFFSDKIEIGDSIVVNRQSASGGKVDDLDAEQDNFEIHRTNAHEIVGKMVDGEFKPVGGRFVLKPVYLGYTEDEDGHYRLNGSSNGIKSPVNPDTDYAQVVSVGGGWSSEYRIAAANKVCGPIPFKPGDIVVMPGFIFGGQASSPNNQTAKLNINGKNLYIGDIVDVDMFFSKEEFEKWVNGI